MLLISIKKTWLDKIMSGEKTAEARKTMPRRSDSEAYLYESRTGNGSGKIRAKCRIGEIHRLDPNQLGSERGQELLRRACLSRELAEVYANGDTLYFWDVADVEPVDMALVDVGESRAPMSWRYI